MTGEGESLSTTLDEALADAHLPALLMSLVHMTGDAGLLTEARRPRYVLLADGRQGGYSQGVQADIHARAKAALEARLAGAPLPPTPSDATVRRMMDWIAGVDIPERYVPFLMDELQLSGIDSKAPDWSSPKLKAAARPIDPAVHQRFCAFEK